MCVYVCVSFIALSFCLSLSLPFPVVIYFCVFPLSLPQLHWCLLPPVPPTFFPILKSWPSSSDPTLLAMGSVCGVDLPSMGTSLWWSVTSSQGVQLDCKYQTVVGVVLRMSWPAKFTKLLCNHADPHRTGRLLVVKLGHDCMLVQESYFVLPLFLTLLNIFVGGNSIFSGCHLARMSSWAIYSLLACLLKKFSVIILLFLVATSEDMIIRFPS